MRTRRTSTPGGLYRATEYMVIYVVFCSKFKKSRSLNLLDIATDFMRLYGSMLIDFNSSKCKLQTRFLSAGSQCRFDDLF